MTRSEKVRALWQKYNASPRRHVLEVVLIGLSLVLMARVLVASLAQIKQPDFQFDITPVPLALAMTLLSVLGGTLGWAHIIRALQPKTGYIKAIRYHLTSIAAKYLPGFGWQQISKVIQLNRNGAALMVAALPVTLEMALVIITGMIVGALCLVLLPNSGVSLSSEGAVALVISSLGAISVSPLIFSAWLSRRVGHDVEHGQMALHLLIAELFIIASWIFLGLGLWFTSRISYDTNDVDIFYFILSVAIGFIVSLAAIFVPNGWGVRELTLSILLQSVLPSSMAIISSVMFRAVVVIVEVGCIIPVLIAKYRRQLD